MRIAFHSVLLSLLLVGCGGDDPAGPSVALTFENLPALGTGFVYEGWLIVDDAPVSTGTFGSRASFSAGIDVTTAENATAFVLSIEPAVDLDPAPSNTKLLGGDLSDGTATLSIGHPAAFGDDYTSASGVFVLATPTTNKTDDEKQGIWFTNASPLANAPVSGLMLPSLPGDASGWTYEGWVVDQSTSPPTAISTGKFIKGDPTMHDADNAGTAAGSENLDKIDFAGQDFVKTGAERILSEGYRAVISVEPVPDDDEDKPFVLKPLGITITERVAPATQDFANTIADNTVTGTATIR